MAHPADVLTLPKGPHSRPALDPSASTGADNSNGLQAPVINDKDKSASSAANGSGLTAADKVNIPSVGLTVDDDFIDDDSDNEMAIDLVEEAGSAVSVKASSLFLPILRDPAIALVSTGSSREDWICTQTGCGKAKGKSLMAAADHISAASHLLELSKAGSATKESLDKLNLEVIRKEYGLRQSLRVTWMQRPVGA
ncbi:unnamed protein product [Closterium sp. Naga37s-1]|nr:unnamed protein product [Closterium sp. Naga37s-1]